MLTGTGVLSALSLLLQDLVSSCPPGTAHRYWLTSNTPEQSLGCNCAFLFSHRCLLAATVRKISPYIKPKER